MTHTIAISQELRNFFWESPANHIEFWDCPSNNKWPPHHAANKETKSQSACPLYPSQVSWDLSQKDECDSYIRTWQMYFQASDYKGKQFLDLDNDDETIAPTYIKGGAWLKHVGHSNTLTVRITCLITNHAPTGEYRKRFFLNKPRACPCQKALVETRHHILYKCERHKQSWNPLRRSINDIS